MKRFLLFYLCLLTTSVSHAQQLETTMLKEGRVWQLNWNNGYYRGFWDMIVRNDTVIDGKKGFYLDYTIAGWDPYGNWCQGPSSSVGCFFEENGRVYTYSKDGFKPVFDFTLNVGDVWTITEAIKQVVMSIDTINVLGRYYRRFRLLEKGEFADRPKECYTCDVVWVEGIGSYWGVFKAYRGQIYTSVLLALYENGEAIFRHEDFNAPAVHDITANMTGTTAGQEPYPGSIYDLQGRRLSGKPAKGLYIKNGRKYMRN